MHQLSLTRQQAHVLVQRTGARLHGQQARDTLLYLGIRGHGTGATFQHLNNR